VIPLPECITDRQARRHAPASGRGGHAAWRQPPLSPRPRATPRPALTFVVPLMRAAFPLSRILGSGRTPDHYPGQVSAAA